MASAASKQTPRAYLIGGDGFHRLFWPSLVAGFCVTHNSFVAWTPMAALHGLRHQAYDYLLDCLMRGSHKMMWWSVFGLLSSSCCAVQLVLNIFSFGCAGFNTYLGPLRPVFLALTITLNVRMWELAIPNLGLPSTPEYFLPSIVVSTALAILLSLLPEIVDFRTRRKQCQPVQSKLPSSGCILVDAVLGLEGLGCVACTSAVRNAIENFSNSKVLANTVALEEKKATITLMCDEAEAKDSIVPGLIACIQNAGFDACLLSIHPGKINSNEAVEFWQDKRSGLLSAVVTGLLSSSCCLLQLGANLLATLNIAHIGCAGFNKVLGPYRLHLRTLTIIWLSYLWIGRLRMRKCCKTSSHRLMFNTVLCLCLMLLPEIIRWSGGIGIAPPTDGAISLKLKVDGMGCEACEAHVRSVMDRSSGVISSRADFKAGFAELEVAEHWGFDAAAIIRKLKEDGYEAALENNSLETSP